jgi:hypothetical protein
MGLPPLVAFKDLGAKPFARAGHGQGLNHPDTRAQVAPIAAIALVAPPRAAGVGASADKGGHFFFQDGDQGQPDGGAHFFVQQLLKLSLTEWGRLGILRHGSHGVLLWFGYH